MRPELQKMLSHCGMEENSGSRTTLVCSNQQCSGPLYKGVRQSVSKKAEPPTETGSANKWLPVKRRKPALAYATHLISQFFFLLCSIFFHTEQLHQVSFGSNMSSGTEERSDIYLPALTALLWCRTHKHLLTNLSALLDCECLDSSIRPIHLSLFFHHGACSRSQCIHI